MANLARISDYNHFNRMQRLVLRLWWHTDLLNNMSTDIDCIDSAGVIAETILDLSSTLDIHSIPNSEWERFFELWEHCYEIDSLLLIPSASRETMQAICREAVEQYCYLLEMVDIRWASVIETLCLPGEDILGQRLRRHHRTARNETSTNRASGHPAANHHRRTARE